MDRVEIRDRLETNLSYNRLPRALTVVQRRRADIIKQWSIDDTQTWFYSRLYLLGCHFLFTNKCSRYLILIKMG